MVLEQLTFRAQHEYNIITDQTIRTIINILTVHGTSRSYQETITIINV